MNSHEQDEADWFERHAERPHLHGHQQHCVECYSGWWLVGGGWRKLDVPMNKVNLCEKFALFSEYWVPRIVGELNGQQV